MVLLGLLLGPGKVGLDGSGSGLRAGHCRVSVSAEFVVLSAAALDY